MKASAAIKDISEMGEKLTKARQAGDVHPKHSHLVWTEYKPGKFDWRKSKGKDGGTTKPQSKSAKLKKFLETTDDDKLKSFAQKPQNDPSLRQLAFNELEKRGVDTSDIDLNTGKFKQVNDTFGTDEDEDDNDSTKSTADQIDDLIEDDNEEENDFRNPDYIKKKFGGLKTKKQRIAADTYIHSKKTKEDDYESPRKEIQNLNRAYAQFFGTDSPLMIASGGAGVGKSYNLHLVAEVMSKKPFDPEEDEPGDGDYDYVEAPEVKSDTQLVQLLKEHNGKTIVFDDSDNVLKTADTLGIMKKATASSGKRMIGKKSTNKSTNVDPFEFTGKILFLTNMNQHDLTKNEHLNAIYSRALKKDINFTKKEKLELMENLKHKMEFTGVPRLEDKQDDVAERDEVFDMIKTSINKMDPVKFTSRTFKEALEIKRSIDRSNKMIEDDPVMGKLVFGDIEDWHGKVDKFLTKGLGLETEDTKLEKAIKHLDI